MPFNASIPQATDRLAKSQQDLLQNNQQLDTSFGINHYAFSDLTANNGMHKYVQLVNQPAIPPGLVNGAETLYAKGTTGLGELYFTRGNGGTEIQLTNGNVLANANGYSFLPGGMLIQWGSTTASGTGTRNINFLADGNISFPVACWQVYAQTHIATITNGIVWSTANISATGFSLGTNPAQTPSGTSFSWFAIGN